MQTTCVVYSIYLSWNCFVSPDKSSVTAVHRTPCINNTQNHKITLCDECFIYTRKCTHIYILSEITKKAASASQRFGNRLSFSKSRVKGICLLYINENAPIRKNLYTDFFFKWRHASLFRFNTKPMNKHTGE